MNLTGVPYLAWAKKSAGGQPLDLTLSSAPCPEPAALGLEGDWPPHQQTDPRGDPELRARLGEIYGCSPENVSVQSGSTLALFLVLAAELRAGDSVVLEHPVYSPIRDQLRALGVRIHPLRRRFSRGYQLPLDDLERLLARGARLLVLTNLHNPTGVGIPPDTLVEVGRLCRSAGARLVVDEVYLDAWEPGRPAAAVVPGAVSVSSLTKVYGLGGLRLGWVVGPKGVLNRVAHRGDYLVVHTSRPAQAVALKVLERREELQGAARARSREGLEVVRRWMDRRPELEWVEPDGGFVCFPRLTISLPAARLDRELREHHGVGLVRGDFFGARRHIRIGFGGDPMILKQGLEKIGQALERYSGSGFLLC